MTTTADYQVVSNGVVVEQVDLPGGLRRTHWKQDVPISSWLYSLGVARFNRAARLAHGWTALLRNARAEDS